MSKDDKVRRRLIRLGFAKGKQVRFYDERFDLVSNPFLIGTLVVIDAIEVKSGRLRRVRIPGSVLKDAL
jgi:hypothetical protein